MATTITRSNDTRLDHVLKSLRNLAGPSSSVDWQALRKLLENSAHKSHKIWDDTENAALDLAKIIKGPEDPTFCRIFRRVLNGGHWIAAEEAAAKRAKSIKPWVVLVCGLNGIRKTSSIYQSWFKDVLFQALGDEILTKNELPDGSNSFFRQLDYIITTVANEEFRNLYEVTDVGTYSSLKNSIFKKYRTVAEMCGILLMKSAQTRSMNVMFETSGRSIASFNYVDKFFSDKDYRKLVVHFDINDIEFAKKSVDIRMLREMKNGKNAIKQKAGAEKIIQINEGGPYGSAVLKQILNESNKVWENVLLKKVNAGKYWYKATISIIARQNAPWSCQARMPNGCIGQEFLFAPHISSLL